MKINVRTVHFTADTKLLAHVEERINRLNRFFDNIVQAEVFLRLEPSGRIQDKITEVRLSVPGGTLFHKSSSKTFEEALNHSISSLERQVKRFKQKRQGR